MTRQFEIYYQNGSGEAGREAWRQQMLGRMFSLSEFVKALKQRFTSWFNRRNGRVGTLWEGLYKSVIVQDDPAALRTMATDIDLYPVRAGMVEDPADYHWCGYAEAMAGKAEAVEGIVTITGCAAENVYGPGVMEEAGPDRRSGDGELLDRQAESVVKERTVETAAMKKRRRLRALVQYRQLLGVAGRPRVREDGVVVRRGVSERVQKKLDAGGGVKRELLMRRVRHFTDGVILGSREFIDGWFERNRSWFGGASAERRKTGARRIGPGWRELHNLRQLRGG